MQFKIGDQVRFLHEVGSGKILEIKSSTVILEDDHGFEMEYPISLLVPCMRTSEDELFEKIDGQTKLNNPIKKPLFIPSRKGEKEWKIDLHMENLVDSHRNMTNHEIVTTQLSHFRKFLRTAEDSKIPRLVIVHGVGTGKLKNEIVLIVNGIEGAEIFDADYFEYGKGASIIERKYNIR